MDRPSDVPIMLRLRTYPDGQTDGLWSEWMECDGPNVDLVRPLLDLDLYVLLTVDRGDHETQYAYHDYATTLS